MSLDPKRRRFGQKGTGQIKDSFGGDDDPFEDADWSVPQKAEKSVGGSVLDKPVRDVVADKRGATGKKGVRRKRYNPNTGQIEDVDSGQDSGEDRGANNDEYQDSNRGRTGIYKSGKPTDSSTPNWNTPQKTTGSAAQIDPVGMDKLMEGKLDYEGETMAVQNEINTVMKGLENRVLKRRGGVLDTEWQVGSAVQDAAQAALSNRGLTGASGALKATGFAAGAVIGGVGLFFVTVGAAPVLWVGEVMTKFANNENYHPSDPRFGTHVSKDIKGVNVLYWNAVAKQAGKWADKLDKQDQKELAALKQMMGSGLLGKEAMEISPGPEHLKAYKAFNLLAAKGLKKKG